MSRRPPAPSAGPIAVIADPDDAARDDEAGLLSRLGCTVAEASTGEDALALARARRPALVVLDIGLTGPTAYEVCRELREQYGQSLPIMFLSAHRLESADEVAGLLIGADDYLAKPIRADVFLARVRRMLARSGMSRAGNSTLTPRERQVLGLLVEGVRQADIAVRLCISEKTASTHIERILKKLGAHSRAQAVAFAVRDQLVDTAA